MTRDVQTVDADASAVAAGCDHKLFAHPQTNADTTLHVTADANDWSQTHLSKVEFSLQP